MVDLKDLSKYVVIPTGEQALDDVDDLRELEGDFGSGIYPLWSDGQQSIMAFAFEPAYFKEEEARAWVEKAMEKKPAELSVVSILQAVVGPIVRALGGGRGSAPLQQQGVGLRGFGEIRRLVEQALDDQYGKVDSEGIKEYPWIVEMGETVVIFEVEGERYAATYQIDENDQVALGDATPVDEQWVRKVDGAPVMLHAFSTRLGAGDEADEGDDELTWKEIIHPGKWFKSDSGREVECTADMIKEVFRAWQAGLPKLISVPTDSHHEAGLVPAESNRGFVEKLKLIGDRLFGGFKFTDSNVEYGVGVGSIADVSVYLQPSVFHPTSGEKFGWILEHVLLTNAPLAQDLAPFGDALPVGASSGEGRCLVQFYQQKTEEVNKMKKNGKGLQGPQEGALTLSAEDVATLEEFKGLALSVADVEAMVAERDNVRQKARDLEITQVVRALEASEEHASVVQVEGHRHYPVVCAAVEKALKEWPAGLAMSANGEGQAELDAVLLEIVNAIPADGRMALDANNAPTGSKEHNDPALLGADAEPSDEQVDELGKRIL